MPSNPEQDYISGGIQTLQLSGANPDTLPKTICTQCPSSMWWIDKQGPRCFCRQTHLMTWTDSLKPTLQGCDGYELAIAQHRARLARQGRGQLDDPMDDYLSESDMEPFDGNG